MQKSANITSLNRKVCDLITYHRLDVRANRYFNFSGSRLSLFLELRNLYNRKNVRAYEFSLRVFPSGAFIADRFEDHWLPLLPSIGISYEF